MFLVEERNKRVVEAYKNGIPRNGRFAWDAAKGQLQLFALLGIKVELANEVIGTIAGDDNVLIICPDEKQANLLKARIEGYLG